MTEKEFLEKFADCFIDTAKSEIKWQTQFKKMDEWSSMMALIVIAMVDTEWNKVLQSEDIHRADTIGDLYKILNQ